MDTDPVPDELDAVEAAIAETCGIINAATAQLVALIGQVIDEDLWVGPGLVSPEHYVAWQCGLDRGQARKLCAVARGLPALPENQALFTAGALTVDQAAVVAKYTPVEKDTDVAAQAPQMTVSQLHRVLSKYRFSDSEPPPDTQKPKPGPDETRDVTFGADEDRWRMRVDLPLDEGAQVEAAMVANRDRLFKDAKDDDEAKDRVTWADALLLMAERSQSVGATERPHSDRHRVLWHLETSKCGDGHDLSLHLGSILPDTMRRYLLCDATVTPVLQINGHPVSVGRAQHIVPDRTRRLIEHRDGACRVPGCDRVRGLQVHHIEHWEDGGPTDTTNLCALCPHHHRLHHLGKLDIRGNADEPDGMTFTDTWGRVLDPSGQPVKPEAPPRTAAQSAGIPTNRYQHPSGERMDTHWGWFGDAVA